MSKKKLKEVPVVSEEVDLAHLLMALAGELEIQQSAARAYSAFRGGSKSHLDNIKEIAKQLEAIAEAVQFQLGSPAIEKTWQSTTGGRIEEESVLMHLPSALD